MELKCCLCSCPLLRLTSGSLFTTSFPLQLLSVQQGVAAALTLPLPFPIAPRLVELEEKERVGLGKRQFLTLPYDSSKHSICWET